ncbi:MAG: hypothetical protein ABL888_05805 [Pirellulaceae bacterium]
MNALNSIRWLTKIYPLPLLVFLVIGMVTTQIAFDLLLGFASTTEKNSVKAIFFGVCYFVVFLIRLAMIAPTYWLTTAGSWRGHMPLRADRPLPFGSLGLVWQDIVLVAVMVTLLALTGNSIRVFVGFVLFGLVLYITGHLFLCLESKNRRLICVMFVLVTIGMLFYQFKEYCIVGTILAVVAAIQLSQKSIKQALAVQTNRLSASQSTFEVGWPHDVLAPRTTATNVDPVTMRHQQLVGLLFMPWFSFSFAFLLCGVFEGEASPHEQWQLASNVILAVSAIAAVAWLFKRFLCGVPIFRFVDLFVGRTFALKNQQIFLSAILILISGPVVFNLASQLAPIPFAVAGSVFAIASAFLFLPPSVRRWSLMGNHRMGNFQIKTEDGAKSISRSTTTSFDRR